MLKSELSILSKCVTNLQHYENTNNLKMNDIYVFHDFLNGYQSAFSEHRSFAPLQ